MRLPGTCSMYSKNAMPQLTSAATIHGRLLSCLRCAYHANVMKILLQASSRTVRPTLRMSFEPQEVATAAVWHVPPDQFALRSHDGRSSRTSESQVARAAARARAVPRAALARARARDGGA